MINWFELKISFDWEMKLIQASQLANRPIIPV